MFNLWKESPLVPFFISISVGIILQDTFETLNIYIIAIFSISLTLGLILKKNNSSFLFSFVAGISLGAFLYSTNTHMPSLDITNKSEKLAKIISTPKILEKATFAKLEFIDADSETGTFYSSEIKAEGIFINKDLSISKGNIIRFETKLEKYDKNKNSYSRQNYRNGTRYEAVIFNWDLINKLAAPSSNNIKNWFQKNICSHLDKNNQSLVNGICFGDKSGFEKSQLQDFKSAGFMHLLAVSGMHIGFVAWISNFLLLRLSQSVRWKYTAKGLTVFIIWSYVSLAGYTPSAIRAGLMFTFYFVAELLHRNISKYQVLALAGIIILVINPTDLFNIGFQLSFSALLGIIFTFRIYNQYVYIRSKALKIVSEYFLLGIGAQLGTLPLCLYYFGYYPSYSLIFGSAAGFLVFLLVILIIATVLATAVGIPAVSHLLNMGLGWFQDFTHLVATLPASQIFISPTAVETVFIIIIILTTILHAEMKLNKKKWLFGY